MKFICLKDSRRSVNPEQIVEVNESEISMAVYTTHGRFFLEKKSEPDDIATMKAFIEAHQYGENSINYGERLNRGRHYLMSIQPCNLNVDDCLAAFGFDENGFD